MAWERCNWTLVALILGSAGGCRVGYDELSTGSIPVGGASEGGDGGATGGSSNNVTTAGGRSGGGSTTGGTASGGTTGIGGNAGATGAGGYAGASSLGDCRSGTYGGHTYLFCNVNVTWTAGRDNCASIGMQLVRVDDAGENQFLHNNSYASPPIHGAWIGASDAAVAGEWRWLNGDLFWLGGESGAPQNGLYNAWYTGKQPSAQQPACAVLDLGPASGWYDSDCAVTQEYVCESL